MTRMLIDELKQKGIAVRREFRNGTLIPAEGYKIEDKWTLHYFNLTETEFIQEVIASRKKDVIAFVKHNALRLYVDGIL
jgi:hypothetical protein